ncbi:MAG TPA: outer membrane lipid asymmetry maintenance protein MlaD [Gammaproteobacteria bacterium]|nr:outer membrane lipid asymmetry maintenance protein MlaD [Gammaproteobacteria bacterium]
MQSSRVVEIWVGLFAVLGLLALFVLAMRVSNLNDFNEPEGYKLTAYFQNIGGLKVKAPVTVAGVRIGRVAGIELDEQSFKAKVTLAIRPGYDQLPDDSSAAILTSGLLGEQYIGLEPGGSDTYLKAGQRIEYTQSALVLENIIGQFLYSKAAGD